MSEAQISEAYADLGGLRRAPAAPGVDAATAFLLTLLLQRLKRVVTQPGSGDRAFIRELCAVHPEKLSDAQRAHVLRLAWRYRWSLPRELRPARDPDLKTASEAN